MKRFFVYLSFILLVGHSVAALDVVPLKGIDKERLLVMEVDYGTGIGEVIIFMRPELAPNHVARIKELVRQGYYDGVIFHRVIENFMAQTGDPKGDGTGGSGQKIDAEFNVMPHMRGTVSMARNGEDENSADSQFFITFDRRPDLDKNYTVWGRVLRGMKTIDAIPRGEPPVAPATIVRMRVAADIEDFDSRVN